jgi:hypothetical protein
MVWRLRLGVALEMVCIALRTGDCDDDINKRSPRSSLRLPKAVNAIPIFCAKKYEGHSPAPTVGRIRSCAVFGLTRLLGSFGTSQLIRYAFRYEPSAVNREVEEDWGKEKWR